MKTTCDVRKDLEEKGFSIRGEDAQGTRLYHSVDLKDSVVLNTTDNGLTTVELNTSWNKGKIVVFDSIDLDFTSIQ